VRSNRVCVRKLSCAVLNVLSVAFLICASLASRPASAQAFATNELTLFASGATLDYHEPVLFRALINQTASGPAIFSSAPTGSVSFTVDSDMPVAIQLDTMGIGKSLSTTADHSCAIVAPGSSVGVVCWGQGYGLGSLAFPPIAALPQSLAAGGTFDCAVYDTAGVKCLGQNQFGQLGNASNSVFSPIAVDVVDLNGPVETVAAGNDHACALMRSGGVKCWGNNANGQLGNNDIGGFRTSPVDVAGLDKGVVQLVARGPSPFGAPFGDRSCVVTRAGGVKCWGANDNNLLGLSGFNPPTTQLTPADVDGFTSGVSAIAMGDLHACALTASRTVKCWGNAFSNQHGQLGNGNNFPPPPTPPVEVAGLSGVVKVVAGGNFNCVLLDNGGVKCWGDNSVGQLGTGIPGDQFEPNNYVDGLTSGVVNLEAGYDFVCAVLAANPTPPSGPPILAGTMKCWGNNFSNQLASTLSGVSFPTPVISGVGSVLSFAQARFGTNGLSIGTHTIQAMYSGDGNFIPGATDTMTINVTIASTTTAVSSIPNPSNLGDNVTFTANVSDATATGTVTFNDGLMVLAAVPVTGGLASFSIDTLPIGTHPITVTYSGDSQFNLSTSLQYLHSVSHNPTTTTLTATPSSSRPGQPVHLTASISPGTVNGGTVAFVEALTTLGTAAVSNGTATLDRPFSLGPHMVTATFSGDAEFQTSQASANIVVDARAGAQLKVSSYNLTGTRQNPAVARFGTGFVVVWSSIGQDSTGSGIYGQLYTEIGHKIGGEFLVNTRKADNQSLPAVAALNSGFVVTWVSAEQDHSGLGIYAQRYGADGKPAGREFQVNTVAALDQSHPKVASLSGGGFVIVWDSVRPHGAGSAIFGQRFDISGKPKGAQFQVNTFSNGGQTLPSVASNGKGFVVVWESATPGAAGLDIHGRRFDQNGEKLAQEFRVNTTIPGDQSAAAVASLNNGFVVTWTSIDVFGLGVYAQRYRTDGNLVGVQFRVNSTTASDQIQPAVSGFPQGGYIVVWASPDGNGRGIYGQMYSGNNHPFEGELRLNTKTAFDQSEPAVATLSDGYFVTAWTWVGSNSSTQGIYGQRFGVDVK
jgi:alpha-tubulin suppressor-like RCC1 family protein